MGNPEASDESRSSVTEDEFGGFRIVIPAAPNWFMRLFLPVWLCGWAVGEVVTLTVLFSGTIKGPPPAFLAVWLIAWTLGGALAFLALAWCWAGREVIVLGDGWMETRREVAGFSRSHSFEIAKVHDLRYSPNPYNPFSMSWSNTLNQWGIGGGAIAFAYERESRYERETHRFGDRLPEVEARRLIKTIRQRFKFPEEPDVEPLPIRH